MRMPPNLMHILPRSSIRRSSHTAFETRFCVHRQSRFCDGKQQIKINNRVNESRNFYGRMSETLHEKRFVGWRLLKFPSSIHVCAAKESESLCDVSSCSVIIALLTVCFQQMCWKVFHMILWLFEEGG